MSLGADPTVAYSEIEIKHGVGDRCFLRVKVLLYNADHIKRPHLFRVKKKKKDTITKVARVFRPVAGIGSLAY